MTPRDNLGDPQPPTPLEEMTDEEWDAIEAREEQEADWKVQQIIDRRED